MPFYHVRITPRSTRSNTEVRLDLTHEELEQRFLAPYRQGNPIVIAGKTILANDIERIKINITDETSDLLRPVVEMERRSSNVITGISTSWYIADKGKDVTDDLITGPPGYETDINAPDGAPAGPAVDVRDVFVVHGRNDTARKAMFDFLRSIGLQPLEWAKAVQATGKPTPYIGEILDAAFSRVHAVLVLMTPDDEARLRPAFWASGDPPHEIELTGQARANVLFESGMAMGRDQNRTVLVELGTLRPFSDVAGRHIIRLDNSTQRRQELANRMQAAGCPVNLDGTDWHTAGDFAGAIAVTAGPESTMNESLPRGDVEEISEDAKTLLAEAAGSRDGLISRVVTSADSAIMANGKRLDRPDDVRAQARWQGALGQLVDRGLVQNRGNSDNVFIVTDSGYLVYDDISGKQ